MNWTTIVISVGLILFGLAAIGCAYMCRDNAAEFTAMLAIPSNVVSFFGGWLAKSALANGKPQ